MLLALAWAYAPGVGGPFLLDDGVNIVDNRHIRIDAVDRATLAYVWQAPHPSRTRRLAYLSFALDHALSGLAPAAFRLTNIAIHMTCGLLLGGYFFRLLGTGWVARRYGRQRLGLAWAAALVWALHPIQINSVTYIVQRMNSLAVLFGLLALHCWLSARAGTTARTRGRSVMWVAAAAGCWGLGLQCKEQIAVLPLLIVLQEFLVAPEEDRRMPLWIVALLLAVAGGAAWVLIAGKWTVFYRGYDQRDFTLVERLMTQARVLWHYLSLFYCPLERRFTLFYDYPVSTGLWSPPATLPAVAGWVLAGAGVLLLRGRWRILRWMTGWYLVAHLIESTVIPLEMVYEHRMYLPSAGISLGSVLLVSDGLRAAAPRARVLPPVVLCAVVGVLVSATVSRNHDFRSAEALYRADLASYPHNTRCRLNLAVELLRVGRLDEGGALLADLAAHHPDDLLVQQNWFNYRVYIRPDPAEARRTLAHIDDVLDRGGFRHLRHGGAVWNLVRHFHHQGEYGRALHYLDYLLARGRKSDLFIMQGRCLAALGRRQEARRAFQRAWRRFPADPLARYWYALSLIRTGDNDKGCSLLRVPIIDGLNSGVDSAVARLSTTHCE